MLTFSACLLGQDLNKLVEQSGFSGGLIVDIGGNCADLSELAANKSYVIHGLSTSADDVRNTGKQLQSMGGYGYRACPDVFVINGLVWVGPKFEKGYDLFSGKVRRSIKSRGGGLYMVHDRCHRNKATASVILTSRSGIEVVDVEKGWLENNSWVRGACQYGIMPANGLIYVPPDACAGRPFDHGQGSTGILMAGPWHGACGWR
jgi:hypothetical protein